MTVGDPLPVIQVAGSHRDVGRQLGERCAAAVRFATAFDKGEVPAQGRTMAEQLEVAQQYRRVTGEHLPYLVEELDGVAEGADVDPLRVFAASIEEIWAATPSAGQSPASRIGSEPGRCSDLVAGPPATADGSVLIAHTNDLNAAVEPHLSAVAWAVDDEPRMFTIGVGPWISVGWNDAGLALSGNELSPNDSRVGIPRLLLVREQLRHTTMAAAVDAALHPARASAYNTVFALPDGEVANVEGSATDGVVTGLSAAGTMVHTNHYVCDAMLGYEDDHDYAARSAVRFDRATDLLAEAAGQPGSITEQSLLTMLGDHDGSPDSICRHPSPDSSTKTVFWALTNVTTGQITYGWGNPCDPRAQTYRF